MAVRAMRMLADRNVLRDNMQRALALLQKGEIIPAAYVSRGVDSYNMNS